MHWKFIDTIGRFSVVSGKLPGVSGSLPGRFLLASGPFEGWSAEPTAGAQDGMVQRCDPEGSVCAVPPLAGGVNTKYYTNIIQILYKYYNPANYPNIIQILYKYPIWIMIV